VTKNKIRELSSTANLIDLIQKIGKREDLKPGTFSQANKTEMKLMDKFRDENGLNLNGRVLKDIEDDENIPFETFVEYTKREGNQLLMGLFYMLKNWVPTPFDVLNAMNAKKAILHPDLIADYEIMENYQTTKGKYADLAVDFYTRAFNVFRSYCVKK
jgi:hypothetical protein